MSLLFSTCDICGNVENRLPIARLDLDRGRVGGCGLCTILSRSISSLQRKATESSDPNLKALQSIDNVCITSSETEANFQIEMRGLAEAANYAPKKINIPYQLFLDCANSDIPLSVEKECIVRDVPKRLTLAHAVAYIKRWMASCNIHHPQCAVPESPELPKRILDISSQNGEPIKLLEHSEVHAPYIALSYCWGTTNHMLTTTTANLPQHLRGIPWETLPKVFQDAVMICRALGIRYLWIDALAIIQDDLVDWEQESANMSNIYSNSYITIAASRCADSDKSIFSERWTTLPTFEDTYVRTDTGSIAIEHGDKTFRLRPKLHLAHERFMQLDNARAHAADAPLLTRAWAFQERLLPARTIHFLGEEMIWECKTNLRCECSEVDDSVLKVVELSKAQTAGHEVHQDFSTEWLKPFVSRVESPTVRHHDLCSIWMDLVSEYTRLSLTTESDRLPALSGLAARFLNTSLGDYVAGMWTRMLPMGLLYESHWRGTGADFPQTPIYKPQAPSWSWASIHLAGPNGISYDRAISNLVTECTEFRVVNVRSRVLGKNPFGWVDNASLTIQGNCIKCFSMRKTDGTYGLQLCESPRIPSEQYGLMNLFEDGPYLVEDNRELLFLHLGSGLGLALRRASGSHEPQCWRRVGLASFPLKSGWERHTKLTLIHIV